ncbi:bifunctional 5,10-methylene-tetrahydrofolate dehydrogenase/5,10-methylene-tetrahydrofolate cyclohydrolase [candidate division WWE3 bacterium CG06_land_8_20_14_3_00_42_16]|uniref:Bifunctional protein FolD n=3 Tax=Katanobacteria TaxID=422282 RepID=A0A2M7ANN9_UNCKA|nr:MAG: bifunctional 5,10-methylene-tetrahydrofolate dehydrogenase/5,10-methylene-tetrahydrofolate cyclohydrolase [candidate division WWE3 bacterium CG06_land_8_20_14_3_00_42_16]PJA38544.1 MAG: bifunctional 5,10-methylene-tetrahydrofolate dehydrogenase/5,10-methylene-tetrahydrofolate cyclohydrolase [candidate division WWE3 bacterium CG_4_9_14_3_um_filter_43_9]PJC68571.1 MAG: bifunctional 5,10-methylene-tetrahydrofolate dehydrogenase/5,10-methylene-tetrahydrofolate cyclohydrolase [candidate divisi
MAQIIDGRLLAQKIEEQIRQEVGKMGIKPGLAIILVGNDPASQIYVDSKERACHRVGFYFEEILLPREIGQEKLIEIIKLLNENPNFHGILVQLPLPGHIDEIRVLSAINPKKDVDGFHFSNLGRILVTKRNTPDDALIPATAKAILLLLESTGVPIEGKKAVVLGRSNIVGKPVALLLLQKNATIEICHSKTQNIAAECLSADILIAAIGKPLFVTKEMVKEGTIVIDVGINRIEDKFDPRGYHIVGDVDFENVKNKASFITPVPGGVGPMTIVMLLENTLRIVKNPDIV